MYYFNYGETLYKQMRYEEAKEIYEKAIELIKDAFKNKTYFYRAYYCLASILNMLKDYKRAEVISKRLIKLGLKSNVFLSSYRSLKINLRDQGKLDESAKIERFLKKKNNNNN